MLSYDRALWGQRLTNLLVNVNMDASPGAPYCDTHQTNKIFFDAMGTRVVTMVLDRIENLLSDYVEDTSDPLWRIKNNIMDPVRVFVKNEPHKVDKIRSGRVRLIMSVSIIDKLIEMLLWNYLNQKEISCWETIPSKPGFGFTTQMTDSLYGSVASESIPTLASADVSGWDWSVPVWLRDVDLEVRLQLISNCSPLLRKLAYRFTTNSYRSIYQFSDGNLVTTRDGIVNSGCYNTSSSNSRMRVALAMLVQSHCPMRYSLYAIAMGDDCIERYNEHATKWYEHYGFPLKQYERLKGGKFEFCSHVFAPELCYSLNHGKEIMKLVHNEIISPLHYRMYMISFTDDLQTSPVFNKCMTTLFLAGWCEKYNASSHSQSQQGSEVARTKVQSAADSDC